VFKQAKMLRKASVPASPANPVLREYSTVILNLKRRYASWLFFTANSRAAESSHASLTQRW
jgi:hypothetical protein